MTIADDAGAAPLSRVQIRGLPVPLLERARQHQESLEREFRLVALAAPEDSAHVTARLLALVTDLADRFGTFNRAEAEIESAVGRGAATVDLEYEVPATAAEASLHLGALLDEADAFCRAGELLTLATPPDCVELRRWFLGEFVAQIGGAPPTSWDEWRP